jgi:hypothetical protein
MMITKKASDSATPSQRLLLLCLSILALMASAGGCAYNRYGGEVVETTAIMQAKEEIPEDQLLDVGLLVFASDPLTAEEIEADGTNDQIRKAESHFIPYHLTHSFQESGHWGAVRVVPDETTHVDLLVKGKILQSQGENLAVAVEVVDATGKVWLDEIYAAEAEAYVYSSLEPGRKDAFQDLYNAIANDVASVKSTLSPKTLKSIRTVSQLKFAAEFAPDAFAGYLTESKRDKVLRVNRLPSGDDPMMARLQKIRDRESMYVDVLNEYYDTYYNAMWPSYENWRSMNLQERQAIRKVKQEAVLRGAMGLLLIAGGIALGANDVDYTGALQVGMVVVGGQVIMDGINISQQAGIHSSAIKELSESFQSEMKPVVLEFEGKQYELTGTAGEQFKQWRRLLKQIYAAETGFDLNEPQ